MFPKSRILGSIAGHPHCVEGEQALKNQVDKTTNQ